MLLEAVGAETILIPTIEVVPPTSLAALDASIADLSNPLNDIEWLIFTSANAVDAVANRARSQHLELHPKRIAAIGPATAKAIQQAGLKPLFGEILLPSQFVAESLAESLLARASGTPQKYVLVRAEKARDAIPTMLEAVGHHVTIAAAYSNITPPGALPALKKLFTTKSSYPDAITFTSSSTASNLMALLSSIDAKIPSGIALASIGPITSATLRDHGYEPTVEAEEPTIDSLVAAIASHLKLG